MSKRPAGSGSIYRLPNGTWRALATLDNKRVSFTAKTQRECRNWLEDFINQINKGLTIVGVKTKFDQLLNDWLSIKNNRLRGSTMEQYRRLVDKYIRPQLGLINLSDINAARIQSFYGSLRTKEIGARTIEIIHTIIHGCLKYAHRLGLISQNWAQLVEVPRPEIREMEIWNEAQVSTFLVGAPDQAFYRLAFATGMRRGELIGLQWVDLDWQCGTLKVRRQVYAPSGGGWRFQEPKTARGRRTIRIGPGLVEALHVQFNDTLPLLRSLAGDRWQENDLIFPSTVGTPRHGYEVSKRFKLLVKTAGLPEIRFHDIRHTAASLMLAYGEAPVRVAAILGQSMAVLLDTYAHYIPDDQESSALLMDAITTPIPIQLSRRDRTNG